MVSYCDKYFCNDLWSCCSGGTKHFCFQSYQKPLEPLSALKGRVVQRQCLGTVCIDLRCLLCSGALSVHFFCSIASASLSLGELSLLWWHLTAPESHRNVFPVPELVLGMEKELCEYRIRQGIKKIQTSLFCTQLSDITPHVPPHLG